MILLDTNVVSEPLRAAPDARVIEFPLTNRPFALRYRRAYEGLRYLSPNGSHAIECKTV